MPAATTTLTVAAFSTVPPPDTAAVTVTDRFDTPSSMEVWAPPVPPSASTDRTTVPVSEIVNDAPLTVNPSPAAAPVIDRASVSAATLSERVVNVNVPDPDDDPAEIVTSNESWPDGIE